MEELVTGNVLPGILGAIIDMNYKVPFLEGLTLGATYNKLNIRTDETLLRKVVEDVTFGVDPNNRFLLDR